MELIVAQLKPVGFKSEMTTAPTSGLFHSITEWLSLASSKKSDPIRHRLHLADKSQLAWSSAEQARQASSLSL